MRFEVPINRLTVDVDNVSYLVSELPSGLKVIDDTIRNEQTLREISDMFVAFNALDFLEAAIEATGRKSNGRRTMRITALRLLENVGAPAGSRQIIDRVFDPNRLKKDSDRRLLIEKDWIGDIALAGNQLPTMRLGPKEFSVVEAVAADRVSQTGSR